MRTSAVLTLLAVAATGALANDIRLLFSHPAQDGKTFCAAYKCACINYEPADSTQYFTGAYCQPGNYQGKNTTTQALAYCAFTNANGTGTIQYSTQVGTILHATA